MVGVSAVHGWVTVHLGRGSGDTYPADALLRPVVAIYEGSVGGPRRRRLVFELLATVAGADAFLDLAVDGLLHARLDTLQLRRQGSYVLDTNPVSRCMVEKKETAPESLTDILEPLYTYSRFCSCSSLWVPT